MMEIVILILLIGIGFVVQYILKAINKTQLLELVVKHLVNVTYYVLIPLSFVKTYGEKGVTMDDLGVLITFVIYLILLFSMNTLIQRIMAINDKALSNAILITGAFPNSIFLGFPVSMLFFNDIKIASTLGLVTLLLNIIIPDMMAIGKTSLIKIFTLPALIGFMIGIVIHYGFGDIVDVISTTMYWVPLTTSYLATSVLGMRLSIKSTTFKKFFKSMLVVSVYRFILAPLIAMTISMSMGMNWTSTLQLVLIMSMPPAVMNTIIAQKYRWNPEMVATITFILTIVFIPMILSIYTISLALH
ncbi:MAG: AEC family transporter [Desulfurococcaceae archaeon]